MGKIFDEKVKELFSKHSKLISRTNYIEEDDNNIYKRFKYPIITNKHTPIQWRYNLDEAENPMLLETLGINTTFNPGAIYLNNKYYIMVRVEGFDVKSFFGLAVSENGIDNFKFTKYPILMPQNDVVEKNVYDIRLTKHQDGYIYGTFCAERKDTSKNDTSSAIAEAGIARTKDLINWERLPNIKTKVSQQRNCVLHPEFVDNKYAFYTRPQDGFISTGGQGGICWGLCDDINDPIIDDESIVIDAKEYHTVKEVKNGQGPPPIKTKEGWIHLAHGVRKTAAGLRYVLYCFMTDLQSPWKVIKNPGGHLLAPKGIERVGDVSNVLFCNGWTINEKEEIFIYYASSDTRIHLAKTSVKQILSYLNNTFTDAGNTFECVKQRTNMIKNNLKIMNKRFPKISL